ncbi:pentatricopeptide repeat-containing protein At1g11290, chloroplastic [Selaginella moellendorffii]|nr:pentatricopeptide repeat-containing protein At1g11290, chloroplastic [Selaginella moellendorffii]|eukprot:XP_002992322.2 pentatricopeptide repeat-containing protein At1g11290, chloroplastic [Selaginella moellendorffii]
MTDLAVGLESTRIGTKDRVFDSPSDRAKAKFAALLRQCKSLAQVCAIHDETAREGRDRGTFVGNILVQMYGKYCDLENAREVFERINWKNVFSWTMIIGAYAQNGHPREAMRMYREMCQRGMRADKVAFLGILGASGQLGDLAQAIAIRDAVTATGLDSDVVIANAVIDMLGKCRSAELAREYFDSIEWKDVISWNSMMGAYIQLGQPDRALELYDQMALKPDDATFVAALGACALLELLDRGRAVYERAVRHGYRSHLLVATAAVNMYGKCGRCAEEGRTAFDAIGHDKDTICWTNMISAYAQYGHPREAMRLLWRMEQEGFKPNLATFVALVEACSQLGALEIGRMIYARVVASRLDSDPILGTGILHMYAKFGNVAEAANVFEKLSRNGDIITWNCMLMAHAQHGSGMEVLRLYKEMVVQGLQPSDITFVAILCACSHLGAWEKGHEHFRFMKWDFGIDPTAEHFGCVVDLLGRSGRVRDAESLIESMPVYPGSVVWKVLLSACKLHGNVELAAKAGALASELEPYDHCTYVMLSNVFSAREASLNT